MAAKIELEMHCSQCGLQVGETVEGYTGCCNEPACHGAAGIEVGQLPTFATGHFSANNEDKKTGSIKACCSGKAEEKAQATGVHVLWME